MRIINLDEFGIKLISSEKKQVYLTKKEIKMLLSKQYEIKDHILCVDTKKLQLSDSDMQDFNKALDYIQANFS